MAKKLYEEENIRAIAEKIREKTGTTTTYTTEEMPIGVDEVYDAGVISGAGGALPEGYFKPEGELEITENGTFDVADKASVNVDVEALSEFLKWRNCNRLCAGQTALTMVPLFDTSNATNMYSMFNGCTTLTTVPAFVTSNVTDMSNMFNNCTALTTVPTFDTSNVTNMETMFNNCTSLTTVPLFDTKNVTSMHMMFQQCSVLTTVPAFDTSNVINIGWMFYKCTALTTVPAFDISNVTQISNMFSNCTALTDVRLCNIKTSLQVGSGTSWGHLLTVDSLTHLIYELRDTGSSRTLTVGSANLEKLANVYVKLVDITDEMRAEDDLIDEKLPFVVCESTDEGAILISDYVSAKKWKLA